MREFELDEHGRQILKHRFEPKVKQLKTLDNKHSHKISLIAEFIGQKLAGFYYLGMVRLANRTTIRVDQAKNKFGAVRVYCRLADPDLVQQAWEERGTSDDPEPTEAFKAQCFEKDASHYRETYREMFELFPQFYYSIAGSSDYPALLCETREEADELLDSNYASGWDKDPESRKLLYKICRFK